MYRISMYRHGHGDFITFRYKSRVIRDISFWLLKGHQDNVTELYKWRFNG